MTLTNKLLAVDIGNSAIKLFDGELFHSVQIKQNWVKEFRSKITKPLYQLAGISSVNKEVYNIILEEFNSAGIKYYDSFELLSIASPIDFSNISGMGSDRKCGLIGGGYSYSFPVITVDFGTALTINYADENGVCLGGLIAPGLLTQAKALNTFTSALPLVEPIYRPIILSEDTEAAIKSGIVNLTLSGIDSVIKKLITEAQKPSILFTGGAFNLIKDYPFETKFTYDAYLVLKGILILLSKVK